MPSRVSQKGRSILIRGSARVLLRASLGGCSARDPATSTVPACTGWGSDIGTRRQQLSEFHECRPELFQGKPELRGNDPAWSRSSGRTLRATVCQPTLALRRATTAAILPHRRSSDVTVVPRRFSGTVTTPPPSSMPGLTGLSELDATTTVSRRESAQNLGDPGSFMLHEVGRDASSNEQVATVAQPPDQAFDELPATFGHMTDVLVPGDRCDPGAISEPANHPRHARRAPLPRPSNSLADKRMARA